MVNLIIAESQELRAESIRKTSEEVQLAAKHFNHLLPLLPSSHLVFQEISKDLSSACVLGRLPSQSH